MLAEGLRKEEMTIASAIETGLALEKQHALEAERQQRREKESAAYTTARAVIALHEEIDVELVKLRQMFERRAALLAALAATELASSVTIARLAGKAGPTRAFCAAGLHKFADLMTVPVPSMQPLASANELLIGIGAKPEVRAAPPQRVKLRERTA
jgi:hypothetical protein